MVAAAGQCVSGMPRAVCSAERMLCVCVCAATKMLAAVNHMGVHVRPKCAASILYLLVRLLLSA